MHRLLTGTMYLNEVRVTFWPHICWDQSIRRSQLERLLIDYNLSRTSIWFLETSTPSRRDKLVCSLQQVAQNKFELE